MHGFFALDIVELCYISILTSTRGNLWSQHYQIEYGATTPHAIIA